MDPQSTGAELAAGNSLQDNSQATSLAFSPDGTMIASWSLNMTIQIWDATTGASVGDPLYGHSDLIKSVAFSPDGTKVA